MLILGSSWIENVLSTRINQTPMKASVLLHISSSLTRVVNAVASDDTDTDMSSWWSKSCTRFASALGKAGGSKPHHPDFLDEPRHRDVPNTHQDPDEAAGGIFKKSTLLDISSTDYTATLPCHEGNGANKI